ncbi:hypothetical protein AWL63_23915 (plasmid) [Sphingomonas panacis]|uniref:Uncharacterized protein n=1 Tax=Sphingomonas panacis TaxID=1560345 RepID=A0A1B3ZIG4_9SPHN|nr:hypothetical protein AWL63_23915 [Sphingomonas panacis]
MADVHASGDIGDGVVQLVVEDGEADGDPAGRRQLHAAQALRLQVRICVGDDGKDREAAIQLVERRKPEAGIGDGAQRDGWI